MQTNTYVTQYFFKIVDYPLSFEPNMMQLVVNIPTFVVLFVLAEVISTKPVLTSRAYAETERER